MSHGAVLSHRLVRTVCICMYVQYVCPVCIMYVCTVGVARVDRNLTEPTCMTSSVTKITASTELARYMDCAKPQFAW